MIDELSFIPLYLEVLRQGRVLGTATGFVVPWKGKSCLVTNWHVVTGRNPEKPDDIERPEPTHLRVHYYTGKNQAVWIERDEPLRDENGAALWLEHPDGPPIDVVALPISAEGVFLHRLSWRLADGDLEVTPSEAVSVIGFPFGLASSGKFPIWKTGHLASDLELDYLDRPVFLIDVATKEGMSGSPVIAKRVGFYTPRSNREVVASGDVLRFLGVYSGRRKDSDGKADDFNLGVVWKEQVLREILEHAYGPA
jgi:hypothetical protein